MWVDLGQSVHGEACFSAHDRTCSVPAGLAAHSFLQWQHVTLAAFVVGPLCCLDVSVSEGKPSSFFLLVRRFTGWISRFMIPVCSL